MARIIIIAALLITGFGFSSLDESPKVDFNSNEEFDMDGK